MKSVSSSAQRKRPVSLFIGEMALLGAERVQKAYNTILPAFSLSRPWAKARVFLTWFSIVFDIY